VKSGAADLDWIELSPATDTERVASGVPTGPPAR
jgi:hypothetical protein